MESFNNSIKRDYSMEGQPYLDYGVFLTNCYGENIIRLLVRDPNCIFSYWEIAESVSNDVALAIRITNISNGISEIKHIRDKIGNYYITTVPCSIYEVEIGFYEGAVFRVLAKSNKVITPQKEPSKVYSGSSSASSTALLQNK